MQVWWQEKLYEKKRIKFKAVFGMITQVVKPDFFNISYVIAV
jgi:hypothetical protein